MAYTDFDVATVETRFRVQLVPVEVFPALVATPAVTTGELWQFLRLEGTVVTYDTHRYHLQNLD